MVSNRRVACIDLETLQTFLIQDFKRVDITFDPPIGTHIALAIVIKQYISERYTLIKKKLNHQEEFLVTGLQRQVLIE